jgi:hypothetical protein
MNKALILLACAGMGLSGCANLQHSAQESGQLTTGWAHESQCDTARMARIERAAWWRGTSVYWIHCPIRVTQS